MKRPMQVESLETRQLLTGVGTFTFTDTDISAPQLRNDVDHFDVFNFGDVTVSGGLADDPLVDGGESYVR